jgi:hypothetical protein
MTRNEARKLIKTNAPSKYSNSIVLLLLRLVDLTYRKDKDNAALQITTTRASLLRAAAVERRQLDRILVQLEQEGVLLELSKGNNVTCRIDFSMIEVLPAFGETQRAEKQAHNADRAQKARDTRAATKLASQRMGQIEDAINADLREKVTKEGLLKDVPEGEVKRHMMNWSIDRIMRAQRNAEGAPTGEVV